MAINYHFEDDVLKNALETLNIEFSSDEVKLYIQNIHSKHIQHMPLLISESNSRYFEAIMNEKMAENNNEKNENELKLKMESDVNKFIAKYYKLIAEHDFHKNEEKDSKEQLLIQKIYLILSYIYSSKLI